MIDSTLLTFIGAVLALLVVALLMRLASRPGQKWIGK